MDKIFLDANILFSASYKANSRLLRLWKTKKIKLYTSSYAFEEAKRNILNNAQQQRLVKLAQTITIVNESQNVKILENITVPKKDQPIILAAASSKSSHLLTGDFKHFGRYYGKKICGVMILSPSEYLDNL